MFSNQTTGGMVPGSKMISGSECYEIIEEIGRGGMGIVYKASQTSIQRTVAIKVLSLTATDDPQLLQRFTREGRLCGSLDHPNIVKIFGLVADDQGVPFLVMEYLEGRTLADILSEQKTLDETTFLQVFDQILSALQCAHDKGLVHRDVKPENIMVTTSGTTKIMDFGIAKNNLVDSTNQGLTRTGALLGSPWYMSPEQCSGAPVDARTDLYSVGCVMYECLVGSRPYGGDHPLEVMYKHINQQMSTTTEIAIPIYSGIVCKALAKEPEMRYTSAEEMRTDLHAGPAKRPQTRQRKRAQFSISDTNMGTLIVTTLCLAVCTTIYLVPLARHNPNQAEKQPEIYSARQLFKMGLTAHEKPFTATESADVELNRQSLDYLKRATQQAHRESNFNLEAEAILAQQTLNPEEFAKNGKSIFKTANSLFERGNPSAPGHVACLLSLSGWHMHHGTPQEAIAAAKDALAVIQTTPDYSLKNSHTCAAYLICADGYHRLKSDAEADRFYELAIKSTADIQGDIRGLAQAKTMYAKFLRAVQKYRKADEQIKQTIDLYKLIQTETQIIQPLQSEPVQQPLREHVQNLMKDDQKKLASLEEELLLNAQDLKAQVHSAKH